MINESLNRISIVVIDDLSSIQKYRDQLSQSYFFLEDEVYWQPASSKTALYDQLAKKKYREILRKQIK